MINLVINERFSFNFPEDFLEQIGEKALKCLGEEQSDLTIVVDDDAFIQNLNRQYRGIDSATDVLSFEMGYIDPETTRKYLGDIVLSAETLAHNAEQTHTEIGEETRTLIVHGILHLLGYDHSTDQEQKEMWEKQAEVINFIKQQI